MQKSKTVLYNNGVATFAELRAVRLRRLTGWRDNTHTLTVSGGVTAGDGLGGLFYCDFSDTTTADNGTTVIVGPDGVRFKRVTSTPGGTGTSGAAYVDTFAAVRATVDPSLTTVCWALGAATLGDGVVRLFKWNPASTAGDDNSTVLTSSLSATGRWIQIFG